MHPSLRSFDQWQVVVYGIEFNPQSLLDGTTCQEGPVDRIVVCSLVFFLRGEGLLIQHFVDHVCHLRLETHVPKRPIHRATRAVAKVADGANASLDFLLCSAQSLSLCCHLTLQAIEL